MGSARGKKSQGNGWGENGFRVGGENLKPIFENNEKPDQQIRKTANQGEEGKTETLKKTRWV